MSPPTQSPPTPYIDVPLNFDCNLLSESLSLDTISIVSTESIPPFPPGCMVPLLSFLSLDDLPCNRTNSKLDSLSSATTTIPTPPRLRTLLKENLCISKWTETLITADAPGHVPWGEVESNESTIWKPEGSLYSCDAFQQALLNSRQRTPLTNITNRRISSNSNAHHRKALVFEHEITLPSDIGTKRWSVQVPAGSMNPDMVDMMLELRNLNTFFKEEEELEGIALNQASKLEVPPISVDQEYAHPPSLIVSDSHSVIPLSLESSGSLQTVQKTLAGRRGNNSIPPLAIKSELMDPSTYPSIPSAFLGSPSSYRPTFEFIRDSRSSTDFEDMIRSLHSQCASLQVTAPPCPALLEEEEISSSLIQMSQSQHSSSSSTTDEWAFANSLLEKYPDFCVEQGFDPPHADSNNSHENHPEVMTTLIPSEMLSLSLNVNDPVNISPSSPSVASSTSPTLLSNSPRGILKRCKSVRFAENPLLDQVPSKPVLKQEKEIIRTPIRHSLVPLTTRALKRPSPLRHTLNPQSTIVPPPTESVVSTITRKSTPSHPGFNATKLSSIAAQPVKRATTTRVKSMLQTGDTPVPSLEKPKEKIQATSLGVRSEIHSSRVAKKIKK
ncbi:hypothetical protein D9757_005796 [Collybiopsis confluens]|uniref:Uncharacterized protein n=1 Tax=Collybiopsis confluens TaxID=2823264 RepID=A0A8H5MB16_9AGAR|nr:hypothetical protein D9757_005796 [Collybiopsis confluens]